MLIADLNSLTPDAKRRRLIMTLLVRNEEDVVRHNIDFHLSMGVDFIIATDNGSTDSTRDILREYEEKGVLRLIDEPNHNHNQAEWNNRMAEIARAQYGADIIFHCDADEFWYPRSGNLKNEILKRQEAILFVDVVNVLLEDKDGAEAFPEDTRFAVVNPVVAKDYQEETKEVNLFYFKYPPKVIFKSKNKMFLVSQGNHTVTNKDDSITEGKSQDIVIYHYPIRSREHFFQKVILGGSAYARKDMLDKGMGFHIRRWYASYKKGLLDEEYKKLILHEGEVDKLMLDGFIEGVDFNDVILGRENKDDRWRFFNRKFEYEDMFQDFYWPWAGHKYFAYDLIRNVKPKLIVELGTHKGTSFYSFCQAVKDARYDANLCAVDTWHGDEQTGFYDDNVFKEAKEIKEKYYGGLKVNLLRKKFDEAVGEFENNSIDLLHIDGLHTYTAVKHDFDTWFHKVKKDGIILLHDIFISRDDFGVHKFWKELKSQYKTIEFHQSYGLGVLFKDSTRYQTFIDKEREWQIRYSYIAEDKKNEETRKSFTTFEKSLAERDSQDETVRRGEWALGLDQQLKDAQAKIAQITSSNSWKITQPLRELRRWLTRPSSQVRRYLQEIAGRSRALYARLPLSHQTKTLHRLILSRYFPGVLRLTNSLPTATDELCESHTTDCPIAYRIADLAAFASNLEIKTASQPVVSIIIPVYGQCDYTLRCLASIADYPPAAPFEVIIVDDCSTDDSIEVLRRVQNIRLIGNSENKGFIRVCNIGASAAFGRYLYFLNNDTVVTLGWLDELVRTFHEFPGTGLVGSKLLYPDGSLQEAGCIIWRDGSACNFGRRHDASLPVYNYAREVDYCSGASIMVPKTLFDELGGFDEHYLPAYCEDADLALKIRDRGYRVIYQPLSTVFHFEGITSGTDMNRGVKAHQVENIKKLFHRWQQRLKDYQVKGEDVDAAKDRRATRRVLILDHCTPAPDQDSGSIDVYNIMFLLREMDFQVTFIPEDNFCYMPQYTEALQRIGIEALFEPHVISVKQHLKEYGSRYDLVFMFRVGVVERHIKAVREYCKKTKVIFNTVDLHYLRLEREAKLLNDDEKMRVAREIKNAEHAAIRAVNVATVISEEELKLLKPDLPDANLYLMPFFRNVPGSSKGFAGRRDIVFVGGYQHLPNVDAVKFFVFSVMPHLRRLLSGVRFYIVGSKPPAEIQLLASEDVIVTGFVENLEPLLDRMRVSVAPLRYGAGIKGKIGTALASGLPVVATSLAAEGMSLIDGETILIADDPENFAQKVSQLYNDETLWYRLSRAGISFAERAWGSDTGWNTLDLILRNAGFISAQRRYPLKLYAEYRMENGLLSDDG